MKKLLLLTYILIIFFRLCYTDIKSKKLENLCIFLLMPCAFFVKRSYLLRAIGAAVPFLLTPFFGFGDILLFSVLGFVFGAQDLLIIFVISSVLAGLWSAYLLLFKRAEKGTKIAYAPFICIGVVILIIKKAALLI